MQPNQEKLTPRRLTKREVAERIAEGLFLTGFGTRADHLNLIRDGRYLGG